MLDPFVFVVCQHGAEKPIKERALSTGVWRLAFSRPGLLTLKRSADVEKIGWLASPLVRLSGIGLGPAKGELAEECFEKAWELATKPLAASTAIPTAVAPPAASVQADQPSDAPNQQVAQTSPPHWDSIHIFERDRALPGAFRFEPGPSEVTTSLADALGKWLQARGVTIPINQIAAPGNRVLDIIISEPNKWFVGYHTVKAIHERWPGGVPPLVPPQEMVSRAYLKMAEALMWSRLPIGSHDNIVEIGSAPGGASQRLLDLGYNVTGIDAAEMDERIVANPRFEHWRMKAAGVRRKLYRKFKWLVCDANVAPNYTLDILNDMVNYEGGQIEGLLLTFKLSSWDQLDFLKEQLETIRKFGFSRVEARQLGHNRRELCVVAQR